MSEKVLPLAGLRVIEISTDSVSTMLCGRMLFELGASVLLVEPPAGHPYRQRESEASGLETVFAACSRGKRSALVDLSDPGARAGFRLSVLEADVVLCDRDGLELIKQCNLADAHAEFGLIIACLSRYGLTGPMSTTPGCELSIQSLAGVLGSNGEIGDEPTRAGVPVAAFGGAFFGAIGVLAAAYKRMKTGKGQFIDISEYDAVISFQGTLISGYLLTGEDFIRIGNRHAMSAPWNNYPTKDGWVVISTVGDAQWRDVAHAMGRPELVDDERFLDPRSRVRNAAILDDLIQTWTARYNSDELLALLEAFQVPASKILTLREALESPQAVHRSIGRTHGRVVPNLPFRLARSDMQYSANFPALGNSDLTWSGIRFPVGRARSGEPAGTLLDGVRVVDIGILTAGPLVGRILGMMGAEVIKVEAPAGERTRRMADQIAGTGYLYHLNNTDKIGVTLDSTTPKGGRALADLVATADVLLTNIGEEALSSMGLAADRVQRANQDLISCSVTGYGGTGPLHGKKSFDMVIQAQTGIMSLTGAMHGGPTKVALSVVDIMAALSAATGVVAALLVRERYAYGGQRVDTSLLDAGLWMTQFRWPTVIEGNRNPTRYGNRSAFHAPHGCFPAVDGYYSIAIRSDQQWHDWLRLSGRDDLLADARYATAELRLAHVEEVESLVKQWSVGLHVDELVKGCTRAGIAAAPVLGLADAMRHPHVAARRMIVTLQSPSAGAIRVLGTPLKISPSEVSVRKAAPELGECNGKLERLLRR